MGGVLTGQWIAAGVDHDSIHPGYFLPTVAGGLVGANAASSCLPGWLRGRKARRPPGPVTSRTHPRENAELWPSTKTQWPA